MVAAATEKHIPDLDLLISKLRAPSQFWRSPAGLDAVARIARMFAVHAQYVADVNTVQRTRGQEIENPEPEQNSAVGEREGASVCLELVRSMNKKGLPTWQASRYEQERR